MPEKREVTGSTPVPTTTKALVRASRMNPDPPAIHVGCDEEFMAINVREVERDQLWLMPPSVRDWLPEDHLAWFVLDVVAELDLAEFYAAYREDGRGGAVYPSSHAGRAHLRLLRG